MNRTRVRESVEPVEVVETFARPLWGVAHLLALAAGASLVIVGAVVLLRGDVDGSWEEPVVSVAGVEHTPLLGLVEIVVGALLLLAGATRATAAITWLGALLLVGGIIAAVERESLDDELAVSSAHAWGAIVLGALLLLSSVIPMSPTRRRHLTAVDDELVG